MTIEPKNAKLRELHEAATPGPWCVEEPMDQELWLVQDGKPTYEWYPLATCPWPDDGDGVPRKAVKANAALIVHLRNHVEHYIALEAENADLKQDNARLREALVQVGKWCCPVLCMNCADNERTIRAALGDTQ